jgi:hypothetical protein
MLHDRQQLDVGVTQRQGVVGEQWCDFAVGEQPCRIGRISAPRAEVHLVDADRRVGGVTGPTTGHPSGVAPLVRQVPHDRPRLRRNLGAHGERVGLVDAVPVRPDDMELVDVADAGACDDALPDPRRAP